VFERLVDLIVEFAQLFQFFFYVEHYEQAVVLRFGKYSRTVGPGPHWIWPASMEDAISVNIKPEPMYCDTQSLTTSDGYIINLQVGFTLRVTDAKTYLLDHEHTDDTIAMLLSGIVADKVAASTWEDVHSGDWRKGLRAKANKKARKRGALIIELIVQDLASGDANRLWIEGVEL